MCTILPAPKLHGKITLNVETTKSKPAVAGDVISRVEFEGPLSYLV